MQVSDYLGQYTNSLANGASAASGANTGGAAAQNRGASLAQMQEGTVFEGSVNSIDGSKVVIGLSNGQTVSARLDGSISLQPGQSVFFQVKSNDGKIVAIKPFADGRMFNPTIQKALDAAGMEMTKDTIDMVNRMMQEGLPIDKNSLSSMRQTLMHNPFVSMQTAVAMSRLGIPVNDQMASQFENYLNDRHSMLGQMEQVMDALPSVFARASGGASDILQLNQQILAILNGAADGSAAQGELQAQDGAGGTPGLQAQDAAADALNGGAAGGAADLQAGSAAENAADLQAGGAAGNAAGSAAGMQAQNPAAGLWVQLAAGSAADLQAGNAAGSASGSVADAAAGSTAGNAADLQAGSAADLQAGSAAGNAADLQAGSAAGNAADAASGGAAGNAAGVHDGRHSAAGSAADLQAHSQDGSAADAQAAGTGGAADTQAAGRYQAQLAEDGPRLIADLLGRRQIAELEAQLKELFPESDHLKLNTQLTSKEFLDAMAGQLNGQQPLDKDALARLFSGKGYHALLKDVMQQQWMLKPEDLKTEHQVEELYQRLNRQMAQIEQLAKQAGMNTGQLSQAAAQVRDNIEFMHQINQAYTYVQIPLKLSGQNAHSDLYVYTNKRNLKKKEGELSAFLHLDLEHLGSTDVSIKMLDKNVSTKFYLSDDAAYDLVQANLPKLKERLSKLGYHCSISIENREEKVDFVEDFLRKSQPPHAAARGRVHRYSFDVRA